MCTAALETCIVIEDGGVCLFFLAFYIKVALFLKRKGQKLPVSHTRHVKILILLLFVNISLVEKSIRGIKQELFFSEMLNPPYFKKKVEKKSQGQNEKSLGKNVSPE